MNPAHAYQRRSVEGTGPIGLIVLLYQAAVVELRRAITAMESPPPPEFAAQATLIEARTRALNRMLAVVGELKRALDFERGGEVAQNLARLYHLSDRLVLQSSFDRDPQPLRELLEQYTLILEAWRELDARPPASPPQPTAWSA